VLLVSASWKNNIELTIFGESHGKAIGITIGNLPSGITIDMDALKQEMKRRAPGQNTLSTARQEADQVDIVSGIVDGITTGAPLTGIIYNSDQHSKDYTILKSHMRPGHSDYPANIKYQGYNDIRGGGHFSGRLTAPIVFAGAIAKQILLQKGIVIGAHMLQIKDIKDQYFDIHMTKEQLQQLTKQQYPVLDANVYSKMKQCIEDSKKQGDSVGGKIECAIYGMSAGIGEPFFDSIESHLSSLLFAIPAVKSVAFGNENISELMGSEANDSYYYQGEDVQTKTNHNGGILGGISTGMPIIFNVGIKPTPSISKQQQTINMETKENTTLSLQGRHDPCIVPRATVVVEAMAALTMLDFMRYL
jgi:chorismate synthase